MSDVRIISLWPPWSHAIACVHAGVPLKGVETRHWHTAYRGPLLIHATKRWDGAMRAVWIGLHDQAVRFLGRKDLRCLAYAKWPATGAIVATCLLEDCRPMAQPGIPGFCQWVEDIWPHERAFGDYSPGRFGLILSDVRALPQPIPFSGRQGKLLEASPELVARVEAQLGGPIR